MMNQNVRQKDNDPKLYNFGDDYHQEDVYVGDDNNDENIDFEKYRNCWNHCRREDNVYLDY